MTRRNGGDFMSRSTGQLADEQLMQTFTFDPRRWVRGGVFSRNPLVRLSDRVERLVVALAILVVLVVIPIAGAIGTATYDARAHSYVQAARTEHRVTGTVTEVLRGPVDPYDDTVVAGVRWTAEGGERTTALQWNDSVKPGDHVDIWVDSNGNAAGKPPPTTSRAAVEAVAIALCTLVEFLGPTALLLAAISWQLGRIRKSQIEHELRTLVG
jgi:hypothetical protein